MKRKSIFRTLVIGVCCSALLSGQQLQAAQPAFLTTSRISDVALTSNGELRGQVLNAQGVPQAKIKVAVGQTNQQPALVSTDETGQFTVQGLTAGVYQVQTSHGSSVYRVWAPRTAPPSAKRGVLVVNNDQVVRGYGHSYDGWRWLANPWVIGLLVASGIAIPLAFDSSS